uniref:Uncharacterized protein n=1 Tax=Rhizophora mucronata TaxID=61149 RepID=A0A2P2PKD6_RHIMU
MHAIIVMQYLIATFIINLASLEKERPTSPHLHRYE